MLKPAVVDGKRITLLLAREDERGELEMAYCEGKAEWDGQNLYFLRRKVEPPHELHRFLIPTGAWDSLAESNTQEKDVFGTNFRLTAELTER